MRQQIRRAIAVALGVAVVSTGLVAPFGEEFAAAQTSFTFVGGGYGHGVGMSQYGARGRADAGQSAAQILGAYYQGTAITGASLAGPKVKLDDATSVEVSVNSGAMYGVPAGGSQFLFALPGDHVVLRVSGSSVTAQQVSPIVGSLVTVSTGAFAIHWDQGAAFSVSTTGRSYQWGEFGLQPKGGSLQLTLDSMTMEQYLYGLGEVPSSWPTEALRAQAIAGRTYAAYRLAHPQSSEFDLYASVLDQAFVGSSQTSGPTGANWTHAVDDTAGQVLTYNGTTIQAFYSSSNGGSSENSEYVWATALPYLRAVDDPWDQATGNARFSWSQTYSDTELQSWIAASGRGNIGSVTSVSLGGNVGASGRVDKATVTVTGTSGSVSMTGNQFRSVVNASASSSRDLLSTKFGLSGAAPLTPSATPTSPVGHSDLVAAFGKTYAVVVGWAGDANAPSSPVTIHAYVDGRLAGAATADRHRTDLEGNTTFGPNHGYAFPVKASATVTTVCLYAINLGDPSANTQLGCTKIDRRPPPKHKRKAKKAAKKVVTRKVAAKH